MKIEQLSGLSKTEQPRDSGRVNANRTASADSSSPLVAAKTTPRPDTVYISAQAETMAQLVARVKQLPDVRQERVDSLRAIATSGGFHHSADDLADAILRDENGFYG
jgi:negative regulator of flagellin synthesis FlgM